MLSAATAVAATLAFGADARAQGIPVSDKIVVTVTANPYVAPAPPPPIPLRPRVTASPTVAFHGFAQTSASNSACPASTQPTSSRTPTASPSVSSSVLGVTFVNPPPSSTRPPTKGRLPFTGLPLTNLLAMAAALVGAGVLLARSKRRHHLAPH